jgi:hypothetical protein
MTTRIAEIEEVPDPPLQNHQQQTRRILFIKIKMLIPDPDDR